MVLENFRIEMNFLKKSFLLVDSFLLKALSVLYIYRFHIEKFVRKVLKNEFLIEIYAGESNL